MKFSEFRYLIYSDLYRVNGCIGLKPLLREIMFGESYKYIFWMRACVWLRSHFLLKFTVYPLSKYLLNKYTYKLGISIPSNTKIGSGLYIGHFGSLVVNPDSVIGNNVNLSHGVTLGQVNRGERKGSPIIGDNVYIAPGAKIIGNVKVGNNVAIGANSVVTRDIPDDAVVVGIPGRVISNNGAGAYVVLVDYDKKLKR